MELRLATTIARNIELFPADKEGERSFELRYKPLYDDTAKNRFCVSFAIEITHPGEFMLGVVYDAWFETSKDIDEDFINSSFPEINAPAIAFPFLRSFISNITLNAGYQPAILPSINFVEYEQPEEDEL